jgi:hypothetical protein
MTDVLISDVPQDVLDRIDQRAAQQGLPRSEFLRRTLEREATADSRTVTMADLDRLYALTADMREPDFEQRAWSSRDNRSTASA